MSLTLTAPTDTIVLKTLHVKWRPSGFNQTITTTVVVSDDPTTELVRLALEERYACHRDSITLVTIEGTTA